MLPITAGDSESKHFHLKTGQKHEFFNYEFFNYEFFIYICQ